MDVQSPFPTRWSHRTKKWTYQAWDLYHENRGLLYIGVSSFTASSMMCVVKLMGDLEEGDSDLNEASATSSREQVQAAKYLQRASPGEKRSQDVLFSLHDRHSSSGALHPWLTPLRRALSFTNGTTVANEAFPSEAPSSHTRVIAAAVSLFSLFGLAMANISMRRVGAQAHMMHSVTYFTAWCLLLSVTSMAALNIPWVLPPNPGSWLLGVTAISFLGFTGQLLATRGFQLVAAGRGSLASYTGVRDCLPFSTTDIPGDRGSAIVLSSAIYVTLTKPTSSSSPSPGKSQNVFDAAEEGEDVGLMPMPDDDNDDMDNQDDDIEAQTFVTPRDHEPILTKGTPGLSVEMEEMKDGRHDVEVL
ncbi:hypothetical protein FRB98_004299 [Tulasnella sp. 332]|nr:hypothetical protein FRB98_004299 [Tulasnella sp. 332]